MRFKSLLILTFLCIPALLVSEGTVEAKLPNGCGFPSLEVPDPSIDISKEGETQKIIVSCFEIFEWDAANLKPGAKVASFAYTAVVDSAYVDPSTGVERPIFGLYTRTDQDAAFIRRVLTSPQGTFYATASNYWRSTQVSGLITRVGSTGSLVILN